MDWRKRDTAPVIFVEDDSGTDIVQSAANCKYGASLSGREHLGRDIGASGDRRGRFGAVPPGRPMTGNVLTVVVIVETFLTVCSVPGNRPAGSFLV